MSDTSNRPFWEQKTLSEMTREEWEALCDGCGKCCVVLMLDDETEEIWETDLACKLFDQKKRLCREYHTRQVKVPGCIQLTAENIKRLQWMPKECAYRRLAEGRGLANWHPLVSGRRESVAEAGMAVRQDLIPEELVPAEDHEDHIIARRWPDPETDR